MNIRSQEKRPVIIGAGQILHKANEPADIKKPLALVEEAVREAEKDAGVADLIQKTDTLYLVNILSET